MQSSNDKQNKTFDEQKALMIPLELRHTITFRNFFERLWRTGDEVIFRLTDNEPRSWLYVFSLWIQFLLIRFLVFLSTCEWVFVKLYLVSRLDAISPVSLGGGIWGGGGDLCVKVVLAHSPKLHSSTMPPVGLRKKITPSFARICMLVKYCRPRVSCSRT